MKWTGIPAGGSARVGHVLINWKVMQSRLARVSAVFLELIELVVERLEAAAKGGGGGFVAAVFFQHADDVFHFQFTERSRPGRDHGSGDGSVRRMRRVDRRQSWRNDHRH